MRFRLLAQRYPLVLHPLRQVQFPIETQGRRLPLQSPIGIRGFRDLVLLDSLMMWVLRLAQDRMQHRIEMLDNPDRLHPTVMEARRHKGRLLTEMRDRRRKPKFRKVRPKKKFRTMMRDHRPVKAPPKLSGTVSR